MGATLEHSILRRFVHGDEGAFEAVYRRYETEVYRWVARIVRDGRAAEEITVEAFWRAFRGRARFDPSRELGPWLRTIATHAALDHVKTARRHAASHLGDAETPITGPPDSTLNDSIRVAFRRLPAKLQVVATLALVEGRPYAEIAEALDVPVGTVKSRVFRATRVLRRELDRMGIRP
jgi:RNA polymerase sigma-70 factor (ECF subfamily)